jgi:hypothetical protein
VKFVRVGNGRISEVPETWAEAERMLEKIARYAGERGANVQIQSVCARVAYGLTCDQSVTPDPTEALLRLMQRLAKGKGKL